MPSWPVYYLTLLQEINAQSVKKLRIKVGLQNIHSLVHKVSADMQETNSVNFMIRWFTCNKVNTHFHFAQIWEHFQFI